MHKKIPKNSVNCAKTPEEDTHTSDSIRSLRKCDLGGVIFSCTAATLAECHHKQLFGLPSQHFTYVRNIEEGLPLFLFNSSNRKLYGLYVAAGRGRLNIDPYAWTNGGSEKTPFAAQVAIRIMSSCQPLEEDEYKRVILDNYYDPLKFWFELDHAQARVLTALFKPSKTPINFRSPPSVASLKETYDKPQKMEIEKKMNGKDVESCQSDDGEDTISDWEVLAESGSSNSNSNSNWNSNGSSNGNAQEDVREREEENVLAILRKTVDSRQRWGSNGDNNFAHHKLLQVVGELKDRITYLEGKQAESAKSTTHLKQTIEESHHKISSLKLRIRSLESSLEKASSSDSCSSLGQFVEQYLGTDNVIYLVGGDNGDSFLSDFDSFSPSLDVLTPLRPMSGAKSYVAVTAFDGRIYVAGGYDGSWFDTVECYDRRKDEWSPQAPFTHEKGCLSGVSIDGNIYMMGGKNSSEYFCEVDMLDPILGKWISFIPMLEKRSTFDAAALNGAIYAVGGYNGAKYLSTGERLDVREPYWKKIASMNSRRGCHSLAIVNGKLYAVGGYDGEMTTSTVESYDPRMPRWVMAEPMNCARGYVATAVLGGSLYAIGGAVTDNDLILDTVECYKDGSGWTDTGLKAMGKRCCSAIAL